MAWKLKKAGIATSFDSRGSYKEQLVHLKDLVPYLDTPGMVYHIRCEGTATADCDETYIGETSRSTSTRLADHRANTKHADGTFASAVREHTHSEDHYFTPGSVTILDKEENWHCRGYRESIQIRALQPSLNRDQGRGKLLGCYDGIIAEFVAPGAKQRVESSKGRGSQGWPATQTQSLTQSPARTQSQPQAQAPPQIQDRTATGTDQGPAVPNSNDTPTPRRGPGRPPGARGSQSRARPAATSTHNMITRRTARQDENGGGGVS